MNSTSLVEVVSAPPVTKGSIGTTESIWDKRIIDIISAYDSDMPWLMYGPYKHSSVNGQVKQAIKRFGYDPEAFEVTGRSLPDHPKATEESNVFVYVRSLTHNGLMPDSSSVEPMNIREEIFTDPVTGRSLSRTYTD